MAERWNEVTLAGVRWLVRQEWQPLLLGAGGLRWEDWRAEDRVEVVKKAPHRSVYRIALDHGAGLGFGDDLFGLGRAHLAMRLLVPIVLAVERDLLGLRFSD